MDNFGGYSGNYSNTEWTAALDLFFSMRFDQADHEFMGGLPYEVVEIIDNATNRNYYVLREIPDFSFYDNNDTPCYTQDDEHGAFAYGWGMAVFNPNSEHGIIVSSGQPANDFISVPVAFEVFEKTNARYFLLNGLGREVSVSGSEGSTNANSISDPSRCSDHS